MSSLNEDEALKIILARHKTESISKPPAAVQKLTASDLSDLETGSSDLSINSAAANQEDCLEKASGWSLAEFQEKIRVEEQQPGAAVENSRSTESSYNALIESYNMLGGSYIRTPDLRTVWQRFDEDNNVTASEKITKNVRVTC